MYPLIETASKDMKKITIVGIKTFFLNGIFMFFMFFLTDYLFSVYRETIVVDNAVARYCVKSWQLLCFNFRMVIPMPFPRLIFVIDRFLRAPMYTCDAMFAIVLKNGLPVCHFDVFCRANR